MGAAAARVDLRELGVPRLDCGQRGVVVAALGGQLVPLGLRVGRQHRRRVSPGDLGQPGADVGDPGTATLDGQRAFISHCLVPFE
jgi:hypothetical protein